MDEGPRGREIYIKAFCPYCWRAEASARQQGRRVSGDFGRLRRRGAQEMIQRADGRTTVPQIFIDGRHVGGCDDLLRARARRASSTNCWPPHDQDRALPVEQRDRPGRQCRGAWSARSARRPMAARRCCSRRKCRACSTAIPRALRAISHRGGGRPGARRVPRGGARARASGCIWARSRSCVEDGKVANRGFVIDPRRRDPGALRQDPLVRRRLADRRELARVRGLSRRRAARWWSTARRSASWA